jgi:apolipoprotein D and lipocalin family protein
MALKLHKILLAACLLALSACSSTGIPAGVQAVANFDLQRYQGQWYEIARLDHRFERGMSNVSANYAPQTDGSVRVINRGYLATSNEWSQALGKAKFTGASNIGSLKVSFFGPFYGGYNVIALDPQYRWALIVGPDLSYCWILARDKQIATEQRTQILDKARSVGVNIEALIWVQHDRQDPGA